MTSLYLGGMHSKEGSMLVYVSLVNLKLYIYVPCDLTTSYTAILHHNSSTNGMEIYPLSVKTSFYLEKECNDYEGSNGLTCSSNGIST
jgi:hypothetical protein